MTDLNKLKVTTLGIEETFTKTVFPEDRPDCIAKLKAASWTYNEEGTRIRKDTCKRKASVTIEGNAFCDKHAGEKLMDLHLGRTREVAE